MEDQKKLNEDILDAASTLVESQIAKSGNTAVVKCQMGRSSTDEPNKEIVSYIGTRTIRDLSNDALFKLGIEMDFMKNSFDAKGQLVIDQNNSEEIAQRSPDFTRQISLTSYLLRNKYRKFGTILVVVSPKWVNDPKHGNWDQETGRAKTNSIYFEKLMPAVDQIGTINISNLDVYALDGQHRLIGMRGVKELATGRIFPKSKNNEPKKEPIEKDEFLALNNCTNAELEDLFEETVTVEYLPAVTMGETMEEAKKRIRSVFVSINKNAKKPLAGETILLDEDDGFAIVARRVGKIHRLLQANTTEGRVNWRNTSIPKRSHWIITLQHLRTMSKRYLEQTQTSMVQFWENKKLGTQRPLDSDMSDAYDAMIELFDQLAGLPTCKRIMAAHKGEDLDKIRLNESNILTRPIGYTIIADAVGQLINSGENIQDIFDKLKKFDAADGFEQARRGGIWYGITFDPKGRMITAHTATAADLIKWKLFGQTHIDGRTLSEKCKYLRMLDTGNQYYSFDGSLKPYSGASGPIDLPDTII
jgi:hypothetical protein